MAPGFGAFCRQAITGTKLDLCQLKVHQGQAPCCSWTLSDHPRALHARNFQFLTLCLKQAVVMQHCLLQARLIQPLELQALQFQVLHYQDHHLQARLAQPLGLFHFQQCHLQARLSQPLHPQLASAQSALDLEEAHFWSPWCPPQGLSLSWSCSWSWSRPLCIALSTHLQPSPCYVERLGVV